jgi:toxin ParE1/3/4
MTVWKVRLTGAAQADFDDALYWTALRFGTSQAGIYEETLSDAIDALAATPQIHGVKSRDDLLSGMMSLHVARNRRKGRHVVLFRVDKSRERTIEVLRILHDAMDFLRHLPAKE